MNETVDPDLADSLGGMIRAIHRAYRVGLNARGLDLGAPELEALRFLERHPGAHLRHLAAETGRDKAQITRATRALEDRDLVTRTRDPDDQRCHRLHLSEAGRETAAIIGEIRSGIEAHLFAGLGAGEQKYLANLLRRCLTSLRTER